MSYELLSAIGGVCHSMDAYPRKAFFVKRRRKDLLIVELGKSVNRSIVAPKIWKENATSMHKRFFMTLSEC